MKTLRFLALLAFAGCAGWASSAMRTPAHETQPSPAATTFQRVMASHKLRCGYMIYPPFVIRDPQAGKISGIMYDLLQEIGRKLNLEIVWQQEFGMATFLDDMENGRFDAACFSIFQTPVRTLRANFSIPFAYSALYLWTSSDHAALSQDFAKLNDPAYRFTTMDGDISTLVTQEYFPKAQTISVPQMTPYADMFLNVALGKADLILMDESGADNFLAHNPGQIRKVSETPLIVYPISLALPAGDVRLKDNIDAAISEIIHTHLFDEILRRYGGRQKLHLLPPVRPYEQER